MSLTVPDRARFDRVTFRRNADDSSPIAFPLSTLWLDYNLIQCNQQKGAISRSRNDRPKNGSITTARSWRQIFREGVNFLERAMAFAQVGGAITRDRSGTDSSSSGEILFQRWIESVPRGTKEPLIRHIIYTRGEGTDKAGARGSSLSSLIRLKRNSRNDARAKPANQEADNVKLPYAPVIPEKFS